MASHREALGAAFDARDLDQLVGLLDERVVWRGLPVEDDPDHLEAATGGDGHDDHDHEHPPMCVSRAEVRAVFEQFLASGGNGRPVVLADAGDSVAVDPQPEPPLGFPLHQVFTFRGERVVLIQDYPDRATALADLGL